MKMKKYLLGLVVLLVGTTVLTSCNDSNDGPQQTVVSYSNGAYIVNSGNMSSNIESTLTHIDFANNTAMQRVFSTANGRSLGNTANDGIVYGSKIYLVVDKSNTIEVVDKKTMKSVKQIKTTELMGNKEGNEPRHIIAGNGCIYFTTYGGYVGVVDTLSFSLKAKYQVGNYPEGLAGYGYNLFVANSNYGQGGGNLSVINLQDGSVKTMDIEGVNNPTKLFIVNGNLYVLDNQYYDASYKTYGENALRLVNYDSNTSKKVVEGNYASLLATSTGYKFYVINAPYGGEASYKVYDLNSNQSTDLVLSEKVFSPCGIEVDPVTGHLFVLSYNKGDGGYADYNANGYVVEYDNTGKKLQQYAAGVDPHAIFFDAGYKLEFVQ